MLFGVESEVQVSATAMAPKLKLATHHECLPQPFNVTRLRYCLSDLSQRDMALESEAIHRKLF
jgi:hypothetical protein